MLAAAGGCWRAGCEADFSSLEPEMEMIALSLSLWHCPNSTDPRLQGEEADRNTKDSVRFEFL